MNPVAPGNFSEKVVFFSATHTVWTLIYHEFKDTLEEKYLKRVSFKAISHYFRVYSLEGFI